MYRIVKRFIDVVFALLGLFVLLPVFLLLFLCICLDSKGTPIFRQQRVGRHGKLFWIYKLRTMNTSAPNSVATNELSNASAYITRVGNILRKTSLDELPQLFNILCGDMSLIGPRPLVPNEKDIHELRMAKGAYTVRPGITGWAQVNGRDCIDPETKAELDAFYANHHSFLLDSKILLFSVICVLTARGVREGSTEFDEDIDEQTYAENAKNRQKEAKQAS